MKSQLIAIVAAVLVVGCGKSQTDWALSQAVFKGDIAAAKQAIADGADVNAKNENRLTPLHLAGFKGHKEIAELLIAKGADVNAKAVDGETPLDRATMPDSQFNTTETADLLRKHGGKTFRELRELRSR